MAVNQTKRLNHFRITTKLNLLPKLNYQSKLKQHLTIASLAPPVACSTERWKGLKSDVLLVVRATIQCLVRVTAISLVSAPDPPSTLQEERGVW